MFRESYAAEYGDYSGLLGSPVLVLPQTVLSSILEVSGRVRSARKWDVDHGKPVNQS